MQYFVQFFMIYFEKSEYFDDNLKLSISENHNAQNISYTCKAFFLFINMNTLHKNCIKIGAVPMSHNIVQKCSCIFQDLNVRNLQINFILSTLSGSLTN